MARWVAGRGKDASTGQLGPLVGVLAGCPWVGGGGQGWGCGIPSAGGARGRPGTGGVDGPAWYGRGLGVGV